MLLVAPDLAWITAELPSSTTTPHIVMPQHTLLVAALAAALAAPLSAAAETSADASGDASTLAAVRVTGSNIKRTDTEASNPVQVIGRQQLEKTGKATVADVLRSISANTGNAEIGRASCRERV